ncbi:MAG TPA: hypothetical protein VK622_08055 [Puia sp.]|nr:hypothetical protein [Puia sp.]
MAQVPEKDNEDAGERALSERIYASLSLREKFTYNMIQGESYFQNCDAFLSSIDEEKKISARLPRIKCSEKITIYWLRCYC